MDGQPIENGRIELVPTAETEGPATGGLIKQGSYDIAADRGPLAGGTYQVRIEGYRPTGEMATNRDRPGVSSPIMGNFVPAQYNSETTLTITIEGDESVDFDLSGEE